MNPSPTEITGAVLFGLAILHTFACSRFQHLSHRFKSGSVFENLFHLLSEVEAVFGIWAGILVLFMACQVGLPQTITYLEKQNFTEPMFVFAIMTVAATTPVISVARGLILLLAKAIPLHRELSIYFTSLLIGPLLGSFITEPAAMTVTAILLLKRYYERDVSSTFKYVTIAVLFVNVSIGGTLTPFAAPPVLMVANAWNWDLGFMLANFGWKAAIAVAINAFLAAMILKKELLRLEHFETSPVRESAIPAWVKVLHLAFLVLIVTFSHHAIIFMGIFLFFLGVTDLTKQWQEALRLRESLLVAFFLAGLVVLGGFQQWWLTPIIRSLTETPLFLGTTALTSITDNAALTYLGSQIANLADAFKYALVAGAVAGGGLTVIANAPNPAGYSILQAQFGPDGISPLRLFLTALPPTLIAMSCLWFL